LEETRTVAMYRIHLETRLREVPEECIKLDEELHLYVNNLLSLLDLACERLLDVEPVDIDIIVKVGSDNEYHIWADLEAGKVSVCFPKNDIYVAVGPGFAGVSVLDLPMGIDNLTAFLIPQLAAGIDDFHRLAWKAGLRLDARALATAILREEFAAFRDKVVYKNVWDVWHYYEEAVKFLTFSIDVERPASAFYNVEAYRVMCRRVRRLGLARGVFTTLQKLFYGLASYGATVVNRTNIVEIVDILSERLKKDRDLFNKQISRIRQLVETLC